MRAVQAKIASSSITVSTFIAQITESLGTIPTDKIHMKCQALFSQKKSFLKKLDCGLLQFCLAL